MIRRSTRALALALMIAMLTSPVPASLVGTASAQVNPGFWIDGEDSTPSTNDKLDPGTTRTFEILIGFELPEGEEGTLEVFFPHDDGRFHKQTVTGTGGSKEITVTTEATVDQEWAGKEFVVSATLDAPSLGPGDGVEDDSYEVKPPNQPPSIDGTTPNSEETLTAQKGTATTFRVQASDPDGDAISTTWFLEDLSDPGRSQVATGSGPKDSYTTTFSKTGGFLVTVEISARGGTVDETWAVEVKEENKDRPPSIERVKPASEGFTASQGDTRTFEARFTDADSDLDTITWRIDGEIPDSGESDPTRDIAGGEFTEAFTHTFQTEGPHAVTVEVTDSNGNTDSLTWGSQHPDLVVTGFEWRPPNPTSDQKPDFRITIENTGAAPADAIEYDVHKDGSGLTPTPTASLGPGESKTSGWHQSDIPLGPGDTDLTAIVDPNDKIVESDESNNRHTETVSVQGVVDAKITGYQNPQDGDTYELDRWYDVQLTVENTGEQEHTFEVKALEPSGVEVDGEATKRVTLPAGAEIGVAFQEKLYGNALTTRSFGHELYAFPDDSDKRTKIDAAQVTLEQPPISGLDLRFEDARGRSLPAEFTLSSADGSIDRDARGATNYEDLPPGTYTVDASFINHQDRTRTVSLSDGETREVKLTLPHEGVDAQIVDSTFQVVGAKDTYRAGDIVRSTVDIENTGDRTYTFFVGYSARDEGGTFYDNQDHTGKFVTLAPGETRTIELAWRVPFRAPAGSYDLITAIWFDLPRQGDQPLDQSAWNEGAVHVGPPPSQVVEDRLHEAVDKHRAEQEHAALVSPPIRHKGTTYRLAVYLGPQTDFAGEEGVQEHDLALSALVEQQEGSSWWERLDVTKIRILERADSFNLVTDEDTAQAVLELGTSGFAPFRPGHEDPGPSWDDLIEINPSTKADLFSFYDSWVFTFQKGKNLLKGEEGYLTAYRTMLAEDQNVLLPPEMKDAITQVDSLSASLSKANELISAADNPATKRVLGKYAGALEILSSTGSNIEGQVSSLQALFDRMVRLATMTEYDDAGIERTKIVLSTASSTSGVSLDPKLRAAMEQVLEEDASTKTQFKQNINDDLLAITTEIGVDALTSLDPTGLSKGVTVADSLAGMTEKFQQGRKAKHAYKITKQFDAVSDELRARHAGEGLNSIYAEPYRAATYLQTRGAHVFWDANARIISGDSVAEQFRAAVTSVGIGDSLADDRERYQAQSEEVIDVYRLLFEPSTIETALDTLPGTQPEPELAVQSEVSLGTVEGGSDGIIPITNEGQALLDIGAVDTSGALSATMEPRSLGPGQEAELPFTTTSVDAQRPLDATVTLESNAPSSPDTVRVVGTLVPPQDENPGDPPSNHPPTASVTAPAQGQVGEPLTLDASGSHDPDGDDLTYTWSTDTPSAVSGLPNEPSQEPTATVTLAEPGPVSFTVTVTDPEGATASETVDVTVPETGPPEDPGSLNAMVQAPATGELGEPITLDATGSTAPEDASYAWSLEAGDASAVDEMPGSSPLEEVRLLAPGTYTFAVSITDGSSQDTAAATIEIEQPQRQPSLTITAPTAEAPAQLEREERETVTIDATLKDLGPVQIPTQRPLPLETDAVTALIGGAPGDVRDVRVVQSSGPLCQQCASRALDLEATVQAPELDRGHNDIELTIALDDLEAISSRADAIDLGTVTGTSTDAVRVESLDAPKKPMLPEHPDDPDDPRFPEEPEATLTATRSIAGPILPGSTTEVTIDLTASAPVDAPAIDEDLPPGFEIAEQSSEGHHRASEDQWIWLELGEEQTRTVEYTVQAPEDAGIGSEHEITGEASSPDAGTVTIGGEHLLRVGQTVPQAVAGEDRRIDLPEIQQAINWWAEDQPVPDTGGETLDLEQTQRLINAWAEDEEV